MRRATGIAAFDLDGTLLRGRTVCEMLAVPCGRVAEIQAFERSTTELAVHAGRIAMAEWYRGISRDLLVEALDSALWAPGAVSAVAELTRNGVEVVIASITWSFAVELFAKRLGVSRYLGTELLADGNIRHVWPRDKGSWLLEQATELSIPADRIAAIGDSSGDTDLLRVASLRVFVGDSVPADLTRVHHLPGDGLERVARLILEAWGSPTTG